MALILPEAPPYIKQRTGVTLSSNLVFSGTTRANLANDVLRAAAFLVPQRCTLDRIGVRVTGAGAAGAKIRVGVYDDDGNLYPDDLIVDGGELDATGTGVLLATINQMLQPGIYWLAGVSNDNTIDWECINTAFIVFLISNLSTGSGGWTVAQAYGALPATFPGGGAVSIETPTPYYRIASWL